MSAISGTAVSKRPEPARRAQGPNSSTEAPRHRLPRARGAARRCAPALAVYGVVKLSGFAFFMWLVHFAAGYKARPVGQGGGNRAWDVVGSWDGWWYQDIAAHGYHPQVLAAHAPLTDVKPNSAAFFPLFPELIHAVSACTGLGTYGSGMLISVLSSFAAAAGIFGVASLMGGNRVGVIAAGLWALAPGSGVEWAVYSDSLFVALASWACYCVMTRRWLTAGLLALVSGLNRPTAAAVIAAVGLAALVALFKRKDGILRPLTAMLIAPWGFVGYILWVGLRMHNLGGYFAIQKSWQHYFDYGHFVYRAIPEIMIGRYQYLWAWTLADLVSLGALVLVPALLLLFLRKRPPLVLIVFSLLTIASAVTSQELFCNIPRYVLPAFPLWIPIAIALNRLKWPSLATLLIFGGTLSGWYAGYVTFQLGTP